MSHPADANVSIIAFVRPTLTNPPPTRSPSEHTFKSKTYNISWERCHTTNFSCWCDSQTDLQNLHIIFWIFLYIYVRRNLHYRILHLLLILSKYPPLASVDVFLVLIFQRSSCSRTNTHCLLAGLVYALHPKLPIPLLQVCGWDKCVREKADVRRLILVDSHKTVVIQSLPQLGHTDISSLYLWQVPAGP